MITLPFVFYEWETKEYGLELSFGSRSTHYLSIDSVLYKIYTRKDSLVLYDRIVCAGKNAVFQSVDSTVRFASCGTSYSYPLKIKDEAHLKLNTEVYFRTKAGKAVENYTMKLQK